ncbi:glycosyltransferase [Arthrobacter sp. NEB 688]|uniref:glycosyltransferase n=1 Tax=Arthrobacter sp. NEB 688 TaxID=904039 RepID=UPI00156508B8|nr:glycosyltransferase [Arthrobacter sp. NEB 688]QKE85801.1 glycosyltransferase [Arthrobacter sp. NEB 688]
MRILHVNKFLYRRGGAEGYMLDVGALQRDAGHEVEVWGMTHPDNLPGLPLADTFAPHVELEPAPGGLAGLAASARMVWSPASGRGLARALDRFRPDLVHFHNVYHQLSPSVLRPVRSRGIPSVMTLHDYKLACPSYQLLSHGEICERCVGGSTLNAVRERCKSGSLGASAVLAVESGLHRRLHAYDGVDRFVSPSHFLRTMMLRAGMAPERIVTLANVVSLDDVAPVPPAPAAPGDPARFVFAGRLSPEKGVDTLVEALGATPTGVELDVAGDGPSRAILEELAARVAPGRVHFHGRLDKAAVAGLVARSRAMVVPSRWYENQPMTILESFAASTPVVATALGGMPELVHDGVEGRVVPPNDPAALARVLGELAADPEETRAMGTRARGRFDAEFTGEVHLAGLAAVYDEARRAAAGGRADTTTEG